MTVTSFIHSEMNYNEEHYNLHLTSIFYTILTFRTSLASVILSNILPTAYTLIEMNKLDSQVKSR